MKTVKLILFSLFLTSALFSCKKAKTTSEKHHKNSHKKHWTYTGDTAPEHWSNLSEKYFACDGKAQSPIDIDTQNAVKTDVNNLEVNYKETPVEIENNGHTLKFGVSDGNEMTFNNKNYQLKQFHMHTLSEHTVDSKHFPLEIHFVNKAEDNTYAVIGVLFSEGEASPFLAKYLSHFPEKKGEYDGEGKLNINDILPSLEHYYHYKGSFTTPPCTEVVEWIVLKDHPTASKAQLETLHQIMKDNFRPVQPLNGRTIDTK